MASHFGNNLMRDFLQFLRTDQHIGLAHHPNGHGAIERANAVVAQVIRSTLLETHHANTDWDTILPSVTFAMNSAISRTTGFTPFALCHGFDAKTPIQHSLGVTRTSAGEPAELSWACPFVVIGRASPVAYHIRSLVSCEEQTVAAARLSRFLPGTLSPRDMRVLATPPGEFFVERILDSRVDPVRGLQFLIKWLDFPDSANSWVDHKDCSNTEQVMAYMRAHHIRRTAGAQAQRRTRCR